MALLRDLMAQFKGNLYMCTGTCSVVFEHFMIFFLIVNVQKPDKNYWGKSINMAPSSKCNNVRTKSKKTINNTVFPILFNVW